MSNNMIECPICNFHFSSSREHCPTCGAYGKDSAYQTQVVYNGSSHWLQIVVAHGAERARQLPQSPRVFQLVD